MFTIITSTLNCADSIEKTALSVQGQKKVSIQWIIVDGGSTDRTQEILHNFRSNIAYYVSEPDSGIYDAWNKACRQIKNEWVIFLGAGDYFASEDVLHKTAEFLKKNCQSEVSYVYGDVLSDTTPPKKLSAREIPDGSWDLYRPKLPYHQGVFHNARYLSRVLPFDTSYRAVSDTKLLLDLQRLGMRIYIPLEISIMASGGLSQNIQNAKAVMYEFFRLEKESDYSLPLINKITYITVTYIKLSIYSVFGQSGIVFLSSLKDKVLRLLTLK